MKLSRLPIVVVDETTPDAFQSKCKELYQQGYKMDSSSCGFVNSAEYDYCSSYQAIFKTDVYI